MRALHLRRRRRAAAAASPSTTSSSGRPAGRTGQRLPAADPRAARELPFLTFGGERALRHRALEARARSTSYAGDRPLAWIDDCSTRAATTWAAQRAAPTLLVPTESGRRAHRGRPRRGAARAGCAAARPTAGLDCREMEGFWPIFFLAVILKIPVARLLYLVWWAVHRRPSSRRRRGADDRDDARASAASARAEAPARPAPRPHAARRAAAPRLPAGRPRTRVRDRRARGRRSAASVASALTAQPRVSRG